MENKQLIRFLVFFGLDEDFNQEQLQCSYRTLAKLHHPDTSNVTDSGDMMILVNDGYDVLNKYAALREKDISGKAVNRNDVPVDDEYYRQYKNAFKVMQQAFDDYFGDGDKNNEGKLDILQHRLRRAKKAFAPLVNDMKYNQWVSDAIDKIYSINKWLE